MFPRLTSTIVLASLSAGALLAAGCANQKPYSLTGSPDVPDQREQARYTDDKGHYHPEWRAGINTPANRQEK